MYGMGQGVLKDDKAAVKWTRLAAEQGDPKAQYNLGYMYSEGQSVHKDYVMAHMYLNIAALSGDENAIENRDLIAKEMTPSQLAESQDLAREWMRKHQ
jgi:TPR repeat protein